MDAADFTPVASCIEPDSYMTRETARVNSGLRAAQLRRLVHAASAGTLIAAASSVHAFDSGDADWRGLIDRTVEVYAPTALPRLIPHLQSAGVEFPPADVVLLATKRERRLELWARNAGEEHHRFVRDYEIMKTSGVSGPKLREGDLQVPEGIYEIDSLNPRSRFHLSLHINYPNAFDRRNAWLDGRRGLGGQIFIHGNELSTGCLAMGDSVIEELFILLATLGPQKNKVVIAPHDPRVEPLDAANAPDAPWWLAELYLNIAAEFKRYQ